MTQLRSDGGSISNYFDRVLSGIGHRGSSFTDIDAIAHDAPTGRFLVQEFKHDGERMTKGQYWMLRDLSKIPRHFTVWMVRKLNDGQIEWADASDKDSRCVLSVDAYRQKYRDWWDRSGVMAQQPEPSIDPGMAGFVDAIRADAEIADKKAS